MRLFLGRSTGCRVSLLMVGRSGSLKPATLAALKQVTPNVFRTDRDGTVRLHVKGGELSVERLGRQR